MKCINLERIQSIETSILLEIDKVASEGGFDYYLLCGSVLGAIRHSGPIPWDSDADIGVPMEQFDQFISTLQEKISNKYYIEYCKFDKKSPALHPEVFAKGIDGRVLHVDIFPLFGMPDGKESQEKHWSQIKKCMKDLHTKRFAYIGNRDDRSIKTTIKRVIHYTKCIVNYPFIENDNDIISRFFELLNKYPFNNSTYSTFPCVGNSNKAITRTEYYGNGCVHSYERYTFRVPEQYDSYLRDLYGDYMTPPPESERNICTRAMIISSIFKKYWNC